MNEASGSDISKTQMDLVDLSENEQSHFAADDDSLHPEGVKGFCVKDYEERMHSLKKENFNLKLRIYFLEEKNPSIPEGAEAIYKQNIDLKVQNEELSKDIQERSDLLCKASKALELLEDQKSAELQHSEMMVEEMRQKIESLQHEVASLQNALVDLNKSTLGNDTGYADFLGAVDSKDVDHQRKLMERDELNENLQRELNVMKEMVKDLQRERKDIASKTSTLLYENDEMKDKMAEVEMTMFEQTRLENELREFKEKWASAQCDLQDTEDKLKETEKERQKTLTILQQTLDALEVERIKVFTLQQETNDDASGGRKSHAKNASSGGPCVENQLLVIKNKEISDLTNELNEAKRFIKELSSRENENKNRDVEKLSSLLSNMQLARNSIAPNLSRVSLEQLSSSFNDLKFHQAAEEKKTSQLKIDRLINEIADLANTKTKEHVAQLQKQMAIFNQKQEVTDRAFETCVELCTLSLEHLQGLAQFLSALIQQKEIRDSLSEMTMLNIQSTLNKTFELSHNAGRFSVDGRLSCLPDISSLDVLMNTARNSLLNVREIQCINKSVQASNNETSAALQADLESAQIELEDFKRVNQVLEDEICALKNSMEDYKLKLADRDENVATLKHENKDIEAKFQEAQKKIECLYVKRNELEKKLQTETAKKFELESLATKNEDIVTKLQQKLDVIHKDLELNWVTNTQHAEVVQRLEGEIINGEAQIAAVRLQMNVLQENLDEIKMSEALPLGSITSAQEHDVSEESKENIAHQAMRRTLEISDDRKRILTTNADSALSTSTDSSCAMCPKHQAKIVELKKYLARAMDKIRFQSEAKTLNDRHIQKQLNNTENFLNKARSNMENILKSRNSEQE